MMKQSRAPHTEFPPFVQESDFLPPLQQNVHVIASGPSVAAADLSSVAQEVCIFVNGSISLTAQYDFRHIAGYVISDKRFIEHNLPLFQKYYNGQPLFITEPVCRTLMQAAPEIINQYNASIKLLRAFPPTAKGCLKPLRRLFHAAPATHPDIVVSPEHHTRKPIAVSLNIATGFVEAGTVAYIAAQLAFSMGASTIHLHGIDLINTQQPRFYENSDSRAPCMLDKAVANRIVPSFDWLAQVYQQHGVEVVNHSPVSKHLFTCIAFLEHVSSVKSGATS